MRPSSPEQVRAIDEHGQKVQAMFSDIAPGYDRANRLMSMGTDVRWRNRAVSYLVQDRPHNILDLCAGTLDSSKAIHRAAPQASIIGGDFSAGMLAEGEKTLRGSQKQKIRAQQLDAHNLPFEDQRFDALFCAFGARNLSKLEEASREMARCLSPGGRLVVLDFFRPEKLWTRSFHNLYNHSVLPVVGWFCTGNWAAYRYLPQSIGRFCSDREYADLLGSIGFENPQIIALSGGIASIVTAQRSLSPLPADAMNKTGTTNPGDKA